ncbi:flippase-like domain-containing protein [bacterium]|nr:flippase-like domain-containing protein [bacterium]
MRKLFFFILLLIGIGLFVFALYSTDLSEVTSALLKLWPYKFLIILSCLFLGEILISALRWFLILKTQDQNLRFRPLYFAKLVGFSFSYLTPVVFFGGEPVRYAILKEETDVPSKYIISSIILEKLILFLISTIYFFIGVFVFVFYLPVNLFTKLLIIGVVFLGCLFGFFLYLKLRSITLKEGLFSWLMKKLYLSKIRIFKEKEGTIKEVEREISRFFAADKKILFQIFIMGGVEIFLIILSFWLIIIFQGKYLDLFKIFAINSMTALAASVPLPAALGSLEVSQAFLFQFFNLSQASGVAFSLIFRGINLLFACFGIIFFLYFQIRILKKKILDFVQKIAKFYEK